MWHFLMIEVANEKGSFNYIPSVVKLLHVISLWASIISWKRFILVAGDVAAATYIADYSERYCFSFLHASYSRV